jgi:ACS family hexuronate transporter-like MFS transporter
MKFVTDPVWWFFLFWLPKFLNERHGVSVIELGLPMIVIYQVSSLGSIGGGWLSSWFLRRGMTLDRARKTTLIIAAVCALPIAYASRTDSLWVAVALVALGTAAHQAFSANIYAIIGDVFPPRAVGSVVGLSSFSGALAGAIIAEVVGWMLQTTGSYVPVFGMFSVAYVLAWLILRRGIPEIAPVSL